MLEGKKICALTDILSLPNFLLKWLCQYTSEQCERILRILSECKLVLTAVVLEEWCWPLASTVSETLSVALGLVEVGCTNTCENG